MTAPEDALNRARQDDFYREWVVQKGLADQESAAIALKSNPDTINRDRFAAKAATYASSVAQERSAVDDALDAEPKLFADHHTDPIALLPVRLETIWFTVDGEYPSGSGHAPTLRVRVYPDDVWLSHLDTTLTRSEADAGAQYWKNPGPDGWAAVSATVRPDRAAWVVQATRPGAPAVTVRDDDSDRPPTTVAMPAAWRFLAITGGVVVADKPGRPIPDPLPIDLLQSPTSWAITWRSALKAGMAIELSLPEGVDSVDTLLVVGVRPDSADSGATLLTGLLHGHAYSTGLGFLPVGAPTNNTPSTQSDWRGASGIPDPAGVTDPPEHPSATALADALGVTADTLARCVGADDAEAAAVSALTLLSWPALGAPFAAQVSEHVQVGPSGFGGITSVDDPAPWRRIRDHLLSHVRSRGPLPMLRVGNQPYGVLPVTSLDDWQPGSDTEAGADLAPWLLVGRFFWRGPVAGVVPSIGNVNQQRTPDDMMVDLLTRGPTATGVAVTRMTGPSETIPMGLEGGDTSPLTFPGPAPTSTVWWTRANPVGPPPPAPDLVADLTAGHTGFPDAASATADYFATVAEFLAHPSTENARAYDQSWPCDRGDGTPSRRRITLVDAVDHPDGQDLLTALTCIRNWSTLDDGPDPLTNAFLLGSTVDQIVVDVLDTGADRSAAVADAARWLPALTEIVAALRALDGIPLPRLCALLAEVLDVYTHRLDAWITSLATSRLTDLRATAPTGIRIGGYGWVENLAPMKPRTTRQVAPGAIVIDSPQDGYLHAPSLQQATSAAVLRSGALTHPGDSAFSINLTSRRARTARWLVAGVRGGQTLSALLGYRFERALHDAQLDTEIEVFRRKYPAPVVAGDEPDDAGTEAAAARNVVDGLRLASTPGAECVAADPTAVAPHIADLSDALDAVSDLLLAETVHHLVGGNPLRAGLAADVLGRGTDLPDSFEVLTTPHRARALTHRLGALLPAGTVAAGWAADDLSRLAPEVDAWVAHLLGPASGWSVTVTTADGATSATATLESFGVGALATALDAASAGSPVLTAAAAAHVGATTGVTLGGTAWTGLQGLGTRIRALLADASPLLPRHLPDQPAAVVDVTGLRQRLSAYAAAAGAHPGAAELAAAAAEPGTDSAAWLARAAAALSTVVGANLPLLAPLDVPAPVAHPDATAAGIDDWLLHHTPVRAVARTFYDTLLLGGLRASRCETLCAAQEPVADSAEPWVAARYGAGNRPRAAAHLVWHQPFSLGGAITGLVFDEWAERLPGADQIRRVDPGSPPLASPPESELTGVAFHYDRPDAKAPQAVLLAVPPNLQRGWTSNSLVQVLRETLDLGKIRAADPPDLNSLDQLLPAIRIPAVNHSTGTVLKNLPNAPSGVDDSPFRLQTTYRTPATVETGLTARVHDPLWLFTRQWQFGEFAAQDAGSPAYVHFNGSSDRLNAWRPAGATTWTAFDPTSAPLDPMIEAEPPTPVPEERSEVEAGAHFRVMFAQDRGLGDQRVEPVGTAMVLGGPDPGTVGLIGAVGGEVPDPQLLETSIASGEFEQSGLAALGTAWSAWYDATRAGHGPDCLDPTRFEHAVELSVGGTALRATGYLGDGFDWYAVDVDTDNAGAAPAPPYEFTDEAIPTTVRYGGIPADRFWEMEDARIDLGAADVSTIDTGRLLLIAFATVYGNDWFLAPLEVPVGSLTRIDQMLVHDVFERVHLINPAGRDDPSWAMYTLDSPEPDHPAAGGLLVLPTAAGAVGEPLERVNLARDEMANLAWAIQHRTTDGRGEAVDCRGRWLAHRPDPPVAGPLPSYRVQTDVPDYWFPLVPVAAEAGVVHFTRGRLETPDESTAPAEGQLVSAMSWLHEEEIPRDGAALTRRAVLARWFDGSYYSWIRREKSVGSGGSASGLEFDTVWPTDPWPR